MLDSISVAMASYNGALYIREQLTSILSQLSDSDEVVVVDDASQDETVQVIRSFEDARIRLHVLPENSGVSAAFTEAISHCSGDIIFLADQDDVWLPGKVQAVRSAFRHNPAVNVVATDAVVIDGSGNVISESYYATRGCFSHSAASNLIKSSFHGCLMAFRAQLKPAVLPLASYHDVWIGLCNRMAGGETEFIPRAYVAYRRHGKNESAPLRWDRQIAKRLGLLANLLFRLPRIARSAPARVLTSRESPWSMNLGGTKTEFERGISTTGRELSH